MDDLITPDFSQSWYALLVALVHFLLLCALFLTFTPLVHKKDLRILPQPKQITAANTTLPTPVSAPVLLYSGPLKKPQPPQQQQAPTPLSAPTHPINKPTQPQQMQPPDKIAQVDNPDTKGNEQKTAQRKQQEQVQTETAKIPAQAEVQQKRRVVHAQYNGPALKVDDTTPTAPTFLTPSQKNKPEKATSEQPDRQAFQASSTTATNNDEDSTPEGRSRRLKLSDLFKNMPHLMNKLSQDAQPGDQLVVVQGDMKYYSFMNQLLEHINRVFVFHNGQSKMAAFAHANLLKRNAGLSIVLDQSGAVVSRTITLSSGCDPADQLILETVDLSSPFPPVPSHFGHKTVRVELVSVVRS